MTPTEALQSTDLLATVKECLWQTKKLAEECFDPNEDSPPDELVCRKVEEFFDLVPRDVFEKIGQPHINPGSNGEVSVNWFLDKGTLELVFYNERLQGYLKTTCGDKRTAVTATDAVDLVNTLAA